MCVDAGRGHWAAFGRVTLGGPSTGGGPVVETRRAEATMLKRDEPRPGRPGRLTEADTWPWPCRGQRTLTLSSFIWVPVRLSPFNRRTSSVVIQIHFTWIIFKDKHSKCLI